MASADSSARPQVTQPDVIMRAEQVTKRYGGTLALDRVDFNVYRGQVNVLIGENGAGKSTLMKIMAGIEQPTAGRILLDGQPVQFRNSIDAERLGIRIIHQELNLFPNLSVADNIFMARERTRFGVVNYAEQERRAFEVLKRLEHPIDPRTLVGDLPIGLQQIVEIARALAEDVRILIMDEPTSALSTAEVNVLFRTIRDLKAQGVSIIYISHKLEELMQIGDYLTVLRDGRMIATARAEDVDIPWIIERMVGRSSIAIPRESVDAVGEEMLRVESLSTPPAVGSVRLHDVSFSVRAGEILGIYGLLGAGRTELLETLVGLRRVESGKVLFRGRDITGSSTSDIIKMGMILVPEDRQRAGIVQTMSVAHNTTLASLRNCVRGFWLSARQEAENVNRMIGDLSIKVGQVTDSITSLSGGNQQKVVVAKCLLTNPRVLLMDEPTRGIDVGAKAEMFQIMSNLSKQGLGVVFASSELEEVMTMADRIIVMSKGRITGRFSRAEATEQALVAASAVGHETA